MTAPTSTGSVNAPRAFWARMPIVRLRPNAKDWARALGRKSSLRAASAMRDLVAVETRPPPFNALDAVESETPATAATSLSVTLPRSVMASA